MWRLFLMDKKVLYVYERHLMAQNMVSVIVNV